MKFWVLLFICAASIFLSGCANPPSYFGNMLYPEDGVFSRSVSKKYKNSIDVIQTKSDALPILTPPSVGNFLVTDETVVNSVKYSLTKANFFCRNSCRYSLSANVKDINLPIFGFNYTATSHIQYVLKDNKNGKDIYNELIVVPCTVRFAEAFDGQERVLRAASCSIKENISHFIRVISR
jgi:hypothetical protein